MVPKNERQSFSAKEIIRNGMILMVLYVTFGAALAALGLITPGHL